LELTLAEPLQGKLQNIDDILVEDATRSGLFRVVDCTLLVGVRFCFCRGRALTLLQFLQESLSSSFAFSSSFALATASRRRLLLTIILQQLVEDFGCEILLIQPLMA